MVTGQVYLTPTNLVTYAPFGSITVAEIPGRAHCGRIINQVPAAGPGQIVLGGYPVDAKDFALRVAIGGEIGVAEFELSDDGGLIYQNPILTTPNSMQNSRWEYEFQPQGVYIFGYNATTAPSFTAGQVWTWSTTASPLLLKICAALSALFRKWALNQGQPIDDIDEADAIMLCQLGRVWACGNRGDIPEDWKMLAREAYRHFALEAKGDIKLGSRPDPDGFVFPNYELTRDPFAGFWRH